MARFVESSALLAAIDFALTLCVRFSGLIWRAGWPDCPALRSPFSGCAAEEEPVIFEAVGWGSRLRFLDPFSLSAAPAVGRLESVGSRDGVDCAGLRVGSGSCDGQ